METKKIEERLEKLLTEPKAIEVDGQKVENHSIADLLEVANYFASKQATSSGKTPLKFARMRSGGAIE